MTAKKARNTFYKCLAHWVHTAQMKLLTLIHVQLALTETLCLQEVWLIAKLAMSAHNVPKATLVVEQPVKKATTARKAHTSISSHVQLALTVLTKLENVT
jgi:hypothetical protein